MESEALLRILMADEGSEDARSIAEEYLTGQAPFQDDVHVRALVFDFLADFANISADWARRAEQYIDHWSDLDDVGRNAAGVELVGARARLMPTDQSESPWPGRKGE